MVRKTSNNINQTLLRAAKASYGSFYMSITNVVLVSSILMVFAWSAMAEYNPCSLDIYPVVEEREISHALFVNTPSVFMSGENSKAMVTVNEEVMTHSIFTLQIVDDLRPMGEYDKVHKIKFISKGNTVYDTCWIDK